MAVVATRDTRLSGDDVAGQGFATVVPPHSSKIARSEYVTLNTAISPANARQRPGSWVEKRKLHATLARRKTSTPEVRHRVPRASFWTILLLGNKIVFVPAGPTRGNSAPVVGAGDPLSVECPDPRSLQIMSPSPGTHIGFEELKERVPVP